MEQEYRLSSELIGHEEDVRSVTTLDGAIITGSRDRTIKVWRDEATSSASTSTASVFTVESNLVGHTSFVSALSAFPAHTLEQLPFNGVISGSRDLSVIVWNLDSGSPALRLTGHKFQVSSVAVGKHNQVISASQDGTIRVHSGPEFKDVSVLEGHEGPVQAILALPDGSFLSGGSDATIRLWSDNKCQQTFKGHTDTVRGLALLEGFGIVSASHDMTLKVWGFDGRAISELIGHTAIVYSVATSSSGLIASASEDNSARVWTHDGQCIAHIPHPGCVWDVTFRPNGDLVTACSDYVARVWSTDPDRQGDEELQRTFEAAIAPKAQGADDGMGGDLPPGLKLEDAVVLQTPGSKDGQIKVIREGSGGMAYSWDSSSLQWEKVGQVCGAAGAGEMQTGTASLDGQQYDHVIDVDIADGAPPLKLGVNRDDNPYEVADRFIERHSLSPGYRDQIADFIVQNTALKRPIDPALNPDPFTGGGAYRPASTPAPYFGGQQNGSVTGGGVDPFTGVSSHQADASSLPATVMLVWNSPVNAAAVSKKLRQLSGSLASASDTQAMALTPSEAGEGGTLDRLLSSASAAVSGKAELSGKEISLLEKLLQWPAASLFPALDISRLIILDEKMANLLASRAGPLELSPLGTLGSALAAACAEPQIPANQQLAMRLLCNAFKHRATRSWIKQYAGAVLDGFATSFTAPQKAVRGASSAFLLNLAIFSRQEPLGTELHIQAVSALAYQISSIPGDDEDALQRGLLALGTFLHGEKGTEMRDLAQDLDCKSALLKLKASRAQRVAAIARETLQLLQN